jgi:hypothetical protein
MPVMLVRDAYKMDDVRSTAIRTYHTSKKITQITQSSKWLCADYDVAVTWGAGYDVADVPSPATC